MNILVAVVKPNLKNQFSGVADSSQIQQKTSIDHSNEKQEFSFEKVFAQLQKVIDPQLTDNKNFNPQYFNSQHFNSKHNWKDLLQIQTKLYQANFNVELVSKIGESVSALTRRMGNY